MNVKRWAKTQRAWHATTRLQAATRAAVALASQLRTTLCVKVHSAWIMFHTMKTSFIAFCPCELLFTVITHIHTRLTAFFSGTTRVSWYQKGKPIWILLKQETVSGSGINWAICKSAPRSRQITTPAPHHSVFYRPDALPAAQPTVWQYDNKKLSYHRGTARCVLSIEILPVATQQCRNYLYNKSWPNRWYEVADLVGGNAW